MKITFNKKITDEIQIKRKNFFEQELYNDNIENTLRYKLMNAGTKTLGTILTAISSYYGSKLLGKIPFMENIDCLEQIGAASGAMYGFLKSGVFLDKEYFLTKIRVMPIIEFELYEKDK